MSSTTSRTIIFGTGGCGRGIHSSMSRHKRSDHLLFVDDNPRQSQVGNVPVLGYQEFIETSYNRVEDRILVGVADPAVRKSIVDRLQRDGLEFSGYISDDSRIDESSKVASTSVLLDRVMVTGNVSIGEFFIGNFFSYIEHDCNVGNYVTFSPRVSCNGNVVIEDGVFIGAGVLIRNGSSTRKLVIGENAIIGMGAVVLDDVEPNSVVAGNPAKRLNCG